MSHEKFIELAQSFIDGTDRSMRAVGEMESLLVGEYEDTELYEFLIEPISLYRPWEGMPYVDEEEMSAILSEAVRYVSERGEFPHVPDS